METKQIFISFFLIIGFILCFSAVGRLDYMDFHQMIGDDSDLCRAAVQGAIGLALMTAAAIIGKDVDYSSYEEEGGETE